MTVRQIRNVAAHFGLGRWATELGQLVNDGKITNREFGSLLHRQGKFRDCLEMLRTVICADAIREYFATPDNLRDLEAALAVARGRGRN